MKTSESTNGHKGEIEFATGGPHEFFVVNITGHTLTGAVHWNDGSNSASISVQGLQPGGVSEKKPFYPASGHDDKWSWDERPNRDYQLNCFGNDRFAVVVLSDYGIGVLVTGTSPDTWQW